MLQNPKYRDEKHKEQIQVREPASVDDECILPGMQPASPQPINKTFCLAQTIAQNQSFS